jgi:DNA polymerase-3 subunit beta
MKLEINHEDLAAALGIVSRAVAQRSTQPILSNVLLATDEGRLRLSATNLELGITSWVPARVQEEGSVTVPARLFAELIGVLPDDPVQLTLIPQGLSLDVRCGASHSTVKGLDAEEFPPMPVADLSEAISLRVDDVKEMISQVTFAASTDEARPVLQGVLFEFGESDLSMVATDGFRLSVRRTALAHPLGQPFTVLIPARALQELARILSDGSESVQMVVPARRGQAIFHTKNVELASQLIEGNFPDYRLIIPRGFKTTAIVNATALLKAARQAEIFAREGNKIVRLNVLSTADESATLEVSAQSELTGSSQVALEASVQGPGLAIAFNVGFLRDVLEAIHTPNVSLQFNANNAPALVRPAGGDNFLHVLMPVQLG